MIPLYLILQNRVGGRTITSRAFPGPTENVLVSGESVFESIAEAEPRPTWQALDLDDVAANGKDDD